MGVNFVFLQMLAKRMASQIVYKPQSTHCSSRQRQGQYVLSKQASLKTLMPLLKYYSNITGYPLQKLKHEIKTGTDRLL